MILRSFSNVFKLVTVNILISTFVFVYVFFEIVILKIQIKMLNELFLMLIFSHWDSIIICCYVWSRNETLLTLFFFYFLEFFDKYWFSYITNFLRELNFIFSKFKWNNFVNRFWRNSFLIFFSFINNISLGIVRSRLNTIHYIKISLLEISSLWCFQCLLNQRRCFSVNRWKVELSRRCLWFWRWWFRWWCLFSLHAFTLAML